MKYFIVMIYLCSVLKFSECSLDAYISGGDFATYSQYPHAVFLIVDCEFVSVCGGSILNQNIVITAAHCTEKCLKGDPVEIRVKYGHHDITKMKTTFMAHYIQHQNYDMEIVINDIGLISTKDKIVLNRVVKRVIIMEHPPVMKYAYISGWGLTEDEELQSLLKHTRSRIQTLEVCTKFFGTLPPGIFCAGPLTGLGTALQGDSGGALMINGYIQIGIVSHNMPGYSLVAYTNVSYYYKWIKTNSKRLYCAQ